MYARCPECKTTYRIGVGDLLVGKGKILCHHCYIFFNALLSLTMNTGDSSEPEPARIYTPVPRDREAVAASKKLDSARIPGIGIRAETFATDRRRRRSHSAPPASAAKAGRWGWGALVLSVLLGIQIAVFEGNRLAQDIHVRPILDRFCARLRCTLPPFRDPDRIQIMDRALSVVPDGREMLEFRLIFANHSELPQAFPHLRLILNELDGYPVAERVFAPSEYLRGWRKTMRMPVGRPFEVRLFIIKPSKEVGGFFIEFQ